MRLALFGGSFDPFHKGHLSVARELRDRDLCDRVLIAPAGLSPGKPAARVSAVHRLNMARLGIEGLADVEVINNDLERHGPSYTITTMVEVRERRPEDDLVLVMGADAWRDFGSWREPRRLLELADVVVFPRGGAELEARNRFGCATILADFHEPVSSTEVRRRIGEGRSIAGLVPEMVLTYIREHGLYGASGRVDEQQGGESPCP